MKKFAQPDFTNASQRFQWERDVVLTRYQSLLDTKPKEIVRRLQGYLSDEAFLLEKQKVVGM